MYEIYNAFRKVMDGYTFSASESDKGFYDKIRAIAIRKSQGDQVFAAYTVALRTNIGWVKDSVKRYWAMWLAGNLPPGRALEIFRILTIQGHTENPNPGPEPPDPNPPGPWKPPQTQGLHCIIKKQADKRQFFCGINTPQGLWLGDYGLNVGGPTVRLWNGTFTPYGQFPECESVFDLYLPPDGQMLLTNEHYACIRKRTPSGWDKKYGRQAQTDLMFYLRRAGPYLYGNWIDYEDALSGVVRTNKDDLNGNTWNEICTFTGKIFPGMCTTGNDIYLVGKTGNYRGDGHPILADFRGNVLSSRPDRPSNIYWGVAKHGNVWLMGTCNGHIVPLARGEIHLFDGATNKTVWSNERNVIHSIESHNGRVYALATWTWTVEGRTSLLISSPDGYSWSTVCEIPCASFFGTRFDDGGVYMFGGKWEEFGSVYFYKY